jgi:hypothetical protein
VFLFFFPARLDIKKKKKKKKKDGTAPNNGWRYASSRIGMGH